MLLRSIGQGAAIGLLALAIGTVHALVKPLSTWEGSKPAAPSIPAKPPAPTDPLVPAVPVPAQPVTGAQAQPTPAPPTPPRDGRMVTLARVKELMAGALPAQIIDAREPGEFAAGRIPGAINLPPSAFSGGIPDAVNQRLSRDLPVVVYCSGGNCDASKSVAMRLKDLGFAQTFVYEEGFNEWSKVGEAVEK